MSEPRYKDSVFDVGFEVFDAAEHVAKNIIANHELTNWEICAQQAMNIILDKLETIAWFELLCVDNDRRTIDLSKLNQRRRPHDE